MRKPTPLKRAIFDSGRRQKEVAEAVGLDEATFSRIVNGLHTNEANRAAIADELGVPASAVFPGYADDDQQAA
jgi:transcriptional regulator with XRE-family HTH domain